MSRSIFLALALALAGIALVHPGHAAASGCGSIQTRHGYVNNIRVTKTRCRTGRAVARAFNACRARHHRGTRCRSQKGFTCRTSNRNSSPSQFYEDVRCKRGAKRVKFLNSVNT